ncbi:hypothetical protein EJ07DRAFT_182911 [Lizonia empirigonia]|nr:hypothetical protein EJ07DRAFT_182911 [Lizonia empirigonia]
MTKSQSLSAQNSQTQLPTPPSSNAIPERGGQTQEQKRTSTDLAKTTTTPTPSDRNSGQQKPTVAVSSANKRHSIEAARCKAERSPSEHGAAGKAASTLSRTSPGSQTERQEAPLPGPASSSTISHPHKRQREDSEDAEQPSKRLCQPRNIAPAPVVKTSDGPALALSESSKHRLPSLQSPQARTVRPEDSFAPITPNPHCDFEFLDYDHDSVPVLYSTAIEHTRSTKLLNCPPEELVFDALDAIEAGFKPFSKYGWPSAIGLLGRTTSKDKPTKVLNNVDLYLHENDNKLYVGSDCGLIIVADYLKLIGVPETQPVRFDGRIPPWAKSALQAREKRKVVQIFGKITKVKKVKHLEESETTDKALEEARARDGTDKKATPPDGAVGANTPGKTAVEQMPEKATEHQGEYDEMLKVDDGDLPLPLGSTVIVYKIDHNDEWAYGRRCDNGDKGWFPVSHTCPVDWSLDRFAGSNADQLGKPLPMSRDPEEQDWGGLTDYIRRKGYPEGPTWKQTCVATAAAAAQAHIANLRSSGAGSNVKPDCNAGAILQAVQTSTLTSNTNEIIIADNHGSAGSANERSQQTATTMKLTGAVLNNLAETLIEDFTDNASGIGSYKSTEKTEEEVDFPAADFERTIVPTPYVAESPTQAASLSEAIEDMTAGAEARGGTMLGSQEQEAAYPSPAHQPASPEPHRNVAITERATAPSPRDPFTVPRYDPFTRNDDIEYDWGESDDEEL